MQKNSLSELPKLDLTLRECCDLTKVFLPKPREGVHRYERKVVVVDGANTLRVTSQNENEPSALGLLALIRMMIKYDFDVEVYLQEVYWKKNIRFGVDSLHVLLNEKIAFPVPADEYDDDYYFKVAQRLGGIVLSNDYFREEQAMRRHDEVYIKSYSTPFTAVTAPKEEQFRMTSDGHFIARHHYIFTPLDGQFFTHHEDGILYAMSKDRNERREKIWPQYKEETLRILDREILKVIEEERINSIRNMKDCMSMAYHLRDDGVSWSGSEDDPLEIEFEAVSADERQRRETTADWFFETVEKHNKRRKIRWQEDDSDSEEEYTESGLRIRREKKKPYVPYQLCRIRDTSAMESWRRRHAELLKLKNEEKEGSSNTP